ncbi:tetratricopeptide repeat-containing sulfotransferase family protein [Aquabacter cavernae]|uniref:tetratricopeptide repeat-containing sulfotransferase family protein n=1 Tax=Aquabacter cavernae TaxID=2496029 RepID=UPI000F8C482A|nr:tetratricopeptide repeat-containing sulfotransferase family protein [Aquabacter cavernae]
MQSNQLTIQEALQRASAHWQAGQAEPAEQLCQRVLAVWPGQPDALHILGLMAHAYGNLDLAVQHLRQAALSPRVPALYLSNLAEMLRQKGILAEAEDMARRAVAIDPSLVSAWNNLGIILQEAGKLSESVSCLERVIAVRPSPEVHNNLGNTFIRMGELEKARAQFTSALALRPAYAEALSNMAYLLNELGEPEEACASAREAIDLNPKLSDAYVNLAAAEISRHRRIEALHWLDSLLAFAPNHGGAHMARAKILMRIDRAEAGLEAAERALALAPQSAEAHATHGELLQAMGRHDESLAAFVRAAELPGISRDNALASRAALLMELGRKQEAIEGYEALLAESPRNVAAWSSRTELKTFTPGDPEIAQMEQLLAPGRTISYKDRMALHFALGKALLDAGDAPRAFAHYGEGNRLKRSTLTFDVAASGRWMDDIAAAMPAEVIARQAASGDPSAMPIFIVGMPRSGTTLLEQILASHPQVHGAGELSTLERLVSGIPGYPATAGGLSPQDIAALGQAYLTHVAQRANGRAHVVDKMPANFLHVGLIGMILPGARIIHSRRNAVDTCLSCYTKLFQGEQVFTYDLAELGAFHRHYERLMAHWRAVMPPERFIEVDYEAVIADQEGETRRLLEALGLPWDDRCLAFHETQRPVRTASLLQVRQPLYKTSAGRAARYAAHLGPLLKALEEPAA